MTDGDVCTAAWVQAGKQAGRQASRQALRGFKEYRGVARDY